MFSSSPTPSSTAARNSKAGPGPSDSSPDPRCRAAGTRAPSMPLWPPNAGRLHPVATRPPTLTVGAALGGVETVDYFGFANTTDSYGIVHNYPDARTEEMDDATLPLALVDPTPTAAVVLDSQRQRPAGLCRHRRPRSPGPLGRRDLQTLRLLDLPRGCAFGYSRVPRERASLICSGHASSKARRRRPATPV